MLVTSPLHPFRLGDLVDQRRGERRVEAHARGAAVGAAPVGTALIADFLEIGIHQAEAIGLYAEQTDTPLAQLRTFREAKLLLANRGLVVGIGNAEFRISIVQSG